MEGTFLVNCAQLCQRLPFACPSPPYQQRLRPPPGNSRTRETKRRGRRKSAKHRLDTATTAASSIRGSSRTAAGWFVLSQQLVWRGVLHLLGCARRWQPTSEAQFAKHVWPPCGRQWLLPRGNRNVGAPLCWARNASVTSPVRLQYGQWARCVFPQRTTAWWWVAPAISWCAIWSLGVGGQQWPRGHREHCVQRGRPDQHGPAGQGLNKIIKCSSIRIAELKHPEAGAAIFCQLRLWNKNSCF